VVCNAISNQSLHLIYNLCLDIKAENINFIVFGLSRQDILVEQELPTLPEHLNSPPVVSGVHVSYRGFESLSGQTNYYKIGICYFSTKHAEQREVSLNIFD
jgi:hypothetical protein